jgi:hypothetical protein
MFDAARFLKLEVLRCWPFCRPHACSAVDVLPFPQSLLLSFDDRFENIIQDTLFPRYYVDLRDHSGDYGQNVIAFS